MNFDIVSANANWFRLVGINCYGFSVCPCTIFFRHSVLCLVLRNAVLVCFDSTAKSSVRLTYIHNFIAAHPRIYDASKSPKFLIKNFVIFHLPIAHRILIDARKFWRQNCFGLRHCTLTPRFSRLKFLNHLHNITNLPKAAIILEAKLLWFASLHPNPALFPSQIPQPPSQYHQSPKGGYPRLWLEVTQFEPQFFRHGRA
jgi:hypothetical protein